MPKVCFPRDLFRHLRIVKFAIPTQHADRPEQAAAAIGSVYPVIRETGSATDSRRTTQGSWVGNSKNRVSAVRSAGGWLTQRPFSDHTPPSFSTTDKRIANGNPSPLSCPQAEKTDCHMHRPQSRLRNESEVSGVAVWNVAKPDRL